jgi:hypothetical protein
MVQHTKLTDAFQNNKRQNLVAKQYTILKDFIHNEFFCVIFLFQVPNTWWNFSIFLQIEKVEQSIRDCFCKVEALEKNLKSRSISMKER